MQLKVLFLFIISMFTLLACQEVVENNLRDPDSVIDTPGLKAQEYIGYDMYGNERACSDLDDTFCSEVFTESDQYGLDCQRDGNLAIQCGCHDWICVDKSEIDLIDSNQATGIDINGEVDSCVPMSEQEDSEFIACTMEFTDEDQFAIDCQADGHRAVQCSCHKFLCLEN